MTKPPNPDAARKPTDTFRFEEFLFDADTGELWRGDEKTLLRPQLTTLLGLLARNPGRVVSREEIRELLWDDQALDVDRGINFCVRQLREELGDDAKQPRFLETLPRRGYRFIASVRQESSIPDASNADPTGDTPPSGEGLDPAERGPESRSPNAADSAPSRRPAVPRAALVAIAALLLFALVALIHSEGTDAERLSEPSEPPSAAEKAFRKGELQLRKGETELALDSFRQAVVLDPEHALAWSQLAMAHIVEAADDPERFQDAAAAVQRAREADPDQAVVYVRSGDLVAMRDHDWASAHNLYREAVEIDPEHVEAHVSLALMHSFGGRWDEAVAYIERAVELGPLDVAALQEAVRIYAAADRPLGTRAAADRVLELAPGSTVALAEKVRACLRAGLHQEARETARRLLPKLGKRDALTFEDPEDFDRLWEFFVEVLDRHAGHRARAARAAFLADLGARHPHHRAAALEELEALVRSGTWILPFVIRDPRFEAIEQEPLFLAALAEVGLEPLPVAERSSERIE